MIRRNQLTLTGLPTRRALRARRALWLIHLLALTSALAASDVAWAQESIDRGDNQTGGPGVPGERDALDVAPPPVTTIYESPEFSGVWAHGPGQCCGNCPPSWRIRADGLLLNQEGNDGPTLSSGFALRSFGYEEGGRVSVIRHFDCLDAWELAYVGPYEWNEFGRVTGAGLTTRLSSATVNLSEFNNATFHSQAYRTQLHNLEVNRRWFGWDVISTLVGVRYMNVDEDYDFNSTGAAGTGLLSIETDNHLAGPQLGMELHFPLGRWVTTGAIKGAAMLNRDDGNVLLVNAGATEIANADDELDFASVIELGYHISYEVTPRVKFRGGYEVWWVYGLAVVPDQVSGPITPRTGSRLDDDEDVYYHGATAGVEVVW